LSYGGDDFASALVVLTLLVGLVQVIAGFLNLGRLMRFVSNAVMIGFLTGVSALVVLSQLGDLTGYSSTYRNNVVNKDPSGGLIRQELQSVTS
jgi:SulP family sulfate permease